MSNVIITLGAATGSGKAITNISIDGIIQTPAKNTSFVTYNYDETITGQKTFNTTIHSVGIMVQSYDNNSVVCAGGGLKAISDITSNYYNKSETYSQTEINNLLNNKADSGVSYTTGEDDALLLLKADKTQLIDSYKKGETNKLHSNKSDSGVSYTKGEADALLLLKADKSTTYIKTETEHIISYIDVGDVDLTDYYNKTKTNELLGEKADTTDLINQISLGSSQIITANKTFSNSSRFVSSNDGMLTVTGSSFIKSGSDNTVVLLGAFCTKPISEFTTTIDDSNYEKKTGQNLQIIQGYLRKGSEPDDVSEDDYDYISRQDVQNSYVSLSGTQQIIGTKSFYDNVTEI
ncbi:MAG: hypothetical protein EZS28_021552 [Streblomastix strix]|uniref:Uncharacterized protein n=1 Tax=Streblomastix strix TaxID=222440 RepID=A0A5J4VK09_9EUKA|nr:MAG: hypothetical protein EZS28_021552 [Streblomastix strix]